MQKLIVYQARTAKSAKTGNDYTSQNIEIIQSPVQPNVTFQRFSKTIEDALAPGAYTCDVTYYRRGDDVLPRFANFVMSASK